MVDDLNENARDRLVALTRGAANAVPFVGGLLGELVTGVIPQQRQDRIVAYLRELSERLDLMEVDSVRAALANPEKIDLIERGGYQAIRSTSTERITQIAEVVTNGLKSDDTEVIRRKRLLTLLSEIDDDEGAILAAYGLSYGTGDYSQWDKIRRPDPPHLGSDRSELDQSQLYDAGKEHLLRLGLLQRNYGNVKKGQYPDFDKNSGGFKGSVEISYLGRMLLREIGVKLPIDED